MSHWSKPDMLRKVSDPDVRVWYSLLPCDKGNSFAQVPGVSRRKVTAKMLQLESRGLVRLGGTGTGVWSVVRWWELTDAGRAVLLAAGVSP